MFKKIKFSAKVYIIISAFFISFFPLTLFSQYPDWINYTNGEDVQAVAVEGRKVWVGTNGGLVQIDVLTDSKTFYNHANSGLPDNYVNAVVIDASGNKWFGTWVGGLAVYTGEPTGIEEKHNTEGEMKVYPNPFTKETVIRYYIGLSDISRFTPLNLQIYDLSGRLVKTLVNESRKPGYNVIKWDGTNNEGNKLSSGQYLIIFNEGSVEQTKKIILMR